MSEPTNRCRSDAPE